MLYLLVFISKFCGEVLKIPHFECILQIELKLLDSKFYLYENLNTYDDNCLPEMKKQQLADNRKLLVSRITDLVGRRI